jgi:hypothetical protein
MAHFGWFDFVCEGADRTEPVPPGRQGTEGMDRTEPVPAEISAKVALSEAFAEFSSGEAGTKARTGRGRSTSGGPDGKA